MGHTSSLTSLALQYEIVSNIPKVYSHNWMPIWIDPIAFVLELHTNKTENSTMDMNMNFALQAFYALPLRYG